MNVSHLSHSPINFYFAKNSRNFVVEELPLYPFSGCGEHLILKIRKKDLTTSQMLNIISENLNIKRREIGYCGLKDKDGLTIQYISINKKLVKNLQNIEFENLKILDSTYHNNKLKLGHLRGNKFFVRVKKLDSANAKKIYNVCEILHKSGFPNYFGYQRFGKNGNNHLDGRALLNGEMKIRDKKISQFLISAYQSHLFNMWLKDRVEFSRIINNFSLVESREYLKLDKELLKKLKTQPQFLKLFNGDVMKHYPDGKMFYNDNVDDTIGRFNKALISPTGVLYGTKTILANDIALEYERKYFDTLLDKVNGDRRFAWVWCENLEFKYKEQVANGEFNFTLPKGSYATVFLEILSNNSINNFMKEKVLI
ncbi:tRNA pseudouridine(13) synthase TruD [Helicobacter didelphidarum]|uniref:tRNA pseudouridine synthase D n=1 Tax=Helicobacter didelphidarum TaxID=2040648 RepID=A0A3D8IJ03_9HELI|nr:tRNA pseudouridine(13) synthase TruD [Helicobacter didelphidarum]RDU64634.1 tRNA pseudouridine(13) synthase TruD [Helicobacter didelphidarum]